MKYEEIEKYFSANSDPKNVPKEVRYAMGVIGIKCSDVKLKQLNEFEGDDEEKQIQCNFHNQQRQSLLLQLVEETQKVIDERLCDETAFAEEEEQHLQSLLNAENQKLQKIFSRQDRETKRLLNEQLSAMEQYEKQTLYQQQQMEKNQRKEAELYNKQQQKIKKKQQILARRQKAETVKREKERKRYLKLLKKREANELKLETEEKKKEKQRQKLLNERIKEFHTKTIKKERDDIKRMESQQNKMHKIAQRYSKENERYINTMKNRIGSVQSSYEERKQRHKANFALRQKQQREKYDQMLKKRQIEAERIRKFEIAKKERLRQQKIAREKKIKKTLNAAKGGEEARLKKIEEAALRAKANREKFFKQKQREDNLKRLVADMKKAAAVKAAERQFRATQFKNNELMLKNQRDDERRIKDLTLKQSLREQRLMNDTQVKLRQNQIKKEIEAANKTGNISRLNALIKELESTETPAPECNAEKSMQKNKKVAITMTPKKIDSSIAMTNKMNVTKLKANIYRTSA